MGRARIAASVLMLLASLPALSQVTGRIALEPQRVGIDMRYSGASVDVRAEVPAGYEAAVALVSHPERLELKKLGKKGGLLWMKVGEISFEQVPALYQVLTTAPLASVAPQTVLAECKLGYDSLVPDEAPGAALRGELVGLKEHDGLFAMREGALQRGGLIQGALLAGTAPAGALPAPPQPLHGTFRLPASAPAGDYTVELIAFKDQHAVHLGSATLRLETVGAARALKHLAIDHGLAYGIAACVVAIVIGLLTGLLFRPKSDEAH